MKDDLYKIYKNAEYEIGDIPFRISVGNLVPSHLLKAYPDLSSFGFLTAHNPESKRLSARENRERSKHLLEAIQSSGIEYITGKGIDPKGIWPDEDSFLLKNISRDHCFTLAIEFGQNAFLYWKKLKPIELVFTKGRGPENEFPNP